jgi:amino-acid N-acetyltransferase
VTPTFEAASAADLGAIRALLLAGDLPVEDVERHIAQFVLAKWDGATIGTVAVEYAGEAGLLRSLCVAPEYRGQAVGTRLLSAIEEVAASRRVRELYLLTTSSAAFFEHHGFSIASRAAAPPGIRGTAQFRELCPSTAICMHKLLPGSSSAAPTK